MGRSAHELCSSCAAGARRTLRRPSAIGTFQGRQAGADIEATKKSIALRCPIPDPIAVLISVLAGQQDASPAVMAEVPRFEILAR